MRIWDTLRRLTGKQGSGRRGRSGRNRTQQDRHLKNRGLQMEQFEDRVLLAIAPNLLEVVPRVGENLLDRNDTGIRYEAPRELTFVFNDEQIIDSNTLAGIRIIRSGGDGQFEIENGAANLANTKADVLISSSANQAYFVGIGDKSNEVIVRFAETLPDDLYRITVVGDNTVTGIADNAPPLRNTAAQGGLAYRYDTFLGHGVDQSLDFELKLGPQVEAVVPQPVVRERILQIDNFSQLWEADTFTLQVGSAPVTFELSSDTFLRSPNNVRVDTSGVTNADALALRIRDAIRGSVIVTGGYASPSDVNAVGNQVTITGAAFTAKLTKGFQNASAVTLLDGGIVQREDLVTVYFDSADSLNAIAAENINFYRLFEANGSRSPLTPTSVRYNAATSSAVLDFGAGGLPKDTAFNLRIGSDILTLGVTPTAVAASDNDSSFAAAEATANNLGVLDPNPSEATIHSISAAIELQAGPLLREAGGNDEPGHRDIPVSGENHIGSRGTAPFTPGTIHFPLGIIPVKYYSFPDTYGPDPQGNTLRNAINPEQKQRTREIFELISRTSGVRFVETTGSGLQVVTGDIRVLAPSAPPGSVGGVQKGDMIIMNSDRYWGISEYGGEWFNTAFHEIGHWVGLDHAYDLNSIMGAAEESPSSGGEVFPTDHDVVHLRRLYPRQSTDIDLYRFEVQNSGAFTAEIDAQRSGSRLDSVLTLYRQDPDDPSAKTVIARNDDFNGEDSRISLDLQPGTYFLGVSSTGNINYDPDVENSGAEGRTDGDYDLTIRMIPNAGTHLTDTEGVALDGDADGKPGGDFVFSFRTAATADTVFVDRIAPDGGTGTVASPINKISDALTTVVAEGKKIVRIVGNAGADSRLGTAGDAVPYLIGKYNEVPLPDGASFEVPAGVTVIVDEGAVIKLNKANIDVGTSDTLSPRAGAALQVLGTPSADVYLTSYHDDTVGGDSNGNAPGAQGGNWGGLVFRADSDYDGLGLQDAANPIFLNTVNHATITYGGGRVNINPFEDKSFDPIHIEAYNRDEKVAAGASSFGPRPTITYNTFHNSANAAISANPNNFDDSLGRGGPHIRGNKITGNTFNGLSVRVEMALGAPLDPLDAFARFDDVDIVHIFTQNLHISGAPGGQITADGTPAHAGRLEVAPGVIVKLGGTRIEAERGGANLIAEGGPSSPVVFTSINDRIYGAGGTFQTNQQSVNSVAEPGNWGGLIFNAGSRGSLDYAKVYYAGGLSTFGGASNEFNTIEIRQADVRIANSLFQNNDDGYDATTGQFNVNRDGRGATRPAVIYVAGAQPIIVNNTFLNNAGATVFIDANSLQAVVRPDYGRSTVLVDPSWQPDDPAWPADQYGFFTQFADNQGPLVRLNRYDAVNSIVSAYSPGDYALNGMEISSGTLDTETVWDDTDIVHVVRGEIIVPNLHTYGGLRLQSSLTESLVVKLQGDMAGITASGSTKDIEDRIGGTLQVIGTPDHPVILTSLRDDTLGAGFRPDGGVQTDTNGDRNLSTGNPGAAAAPGDWRSVAFDRWANDRNVRIVMEAEPAVGAAAANDLNRAFATAQHLGELAPEDKDADENRPAGFEVHGFINADRGQDEDLYSFLAKSGTEVWIDIDRTAGALDTVVELIGSSGAVTYRISEDSLTDVPEEDDYSLIADRDFGGDYYSSNVKDAGFRISLPRPAGATSDVTTPYYLRVKSAGGQTSGEYQLQLRLQQRDEKAGSTVRFADIRYATNGIEVHGLPSHSPLTGEVGEDRTQSTGTSSAQNLGNLLDNEHNTVSVAGNLGAASQVDWYRFTLDYQGIQDIPGINDGGKTWSTVFDLDYADGLSRPDATLAVYDSAGRLIFVSRESDVEDDQPGDPDADFDDLTRGSVGKLDPFIGSVQLPEGNGQTYYVAVSSNRYLPAALNAVFDGTNGRELVRLEPINSIQRIVEDHIGFQGYTSGDRLLGDTAEMEPVAKNGMFNITSAGALDTHVRPLELRDVTLYTLTRRDLHTVNPQTGESTETTDNAGWAGDFVNGNTSSGWLPTTSAEATDLVMRSDGRLYTVVAGQIYEVQTGTSSTSVGTRTLAGSPSIPLPSSNPSRSGATATDISALNTALNNVTSHEATYTPPGGSETRFEDIPAFTFQRTGFSGSSPTYYVYYAVVEQGLSASGAEYSFQKLYRAVGTGTSSFGNTQADTTNHGFRGYMLDASVTPAYASRTWTDSNSASSPTLVLNAVVPGTLGNGIQVVINVSQGSNGVTAINGVITVNRTEANPTVANVVSAINGDANARRYVKAGYYRGSSSVGIQGSTTITLDNGSGNPSNWGQEITGIALDRFNNGTLYGVTEVGTILRIASNGQVTQLGSPHPVSFAGAALGPQNLYEGAYQHYIFANTDDGELYAFDTNDPNGALRSIFGAGENQQSASSTWTSGNVGLAFSPLDVNLWHTTEYRSGDSGHGINPAPDNSRTGLDLEPHFVGPAADVREVAEDGGGVSFYFGMEPWSSTAMGTDNNRYLRYEGGRSQLGVLNEDYQRDLTSNPNFFPTGVSGSYNLPGGASGSLVTNTFYLDDYISTDRPTLYFNYFLQTEDTNSSESNQQGARDTARVFISKNGGTSWEMLATNNTDRNSYPRWLLHQLDPDHLLGELPSYPTHTVQENTRDKYDTGLERVQELFDSKGTWRQARIDLSQYAGLAGGLMLRFDFATAGAVTGSLGSVPGNDHGDANTTGRHADNRHEGFFIDDIIIGLAERGEMVTSSSNQAATTGYSQVPYNNDGAPEPAPVEYLTGPYQLEIRRGTTYGSQIYKLGPEIVLGGVYDSDSNFFDTNSRFVTGETEGSTSRGRILRGDSNHVRQQGRLVLEQNFIAYPENYGIWVDTAHQTAGVAGATSTQLRDPVTGQSPLGAFMKFEPLTASNVTPGVVIENNVVANYGAVGITVEGDPNSGTFTITTSPFARIVNNTIYYGGTATDRVGLIMRNWASPTLMNNILSQPNVNGGTYYNGTGLDSSTWITHLVLHGGTPNLTGNIIPVNTIHIPGSQELFVNPNLLNFNLVAGSAALDSSLEGLDDRSNITFLNDVLGIARSNIVAPLYDLNGDRRVDDPDAPNAPGQGENPFLDRGALERTDFPQTAPTATIEVLAGRTIWPDYEGPDSPTPTIGDRNPANDQITIVGEDLTAFVIDLEDEISGIFDPRTIVNGVVTYGAVKPEGLRLYQDDVLLEVGIDYLWQYEDTTDRITLKPTSGFWQAGKQYRIELLNDPNDPDSIRDWANNPVRTQDTVFIINYPGLDFGDAPDPAFPSLKDLDHPEDVLIGGARHIVIPGFSLGAMVSSEANARQNRDASGDDDDGVTTSGPAGTPAGQRRLLLANDPRFTETNTIQVDLTNTATIKGSDPGELIDGKTFSLRDWRGRTLIFELDFDGTWMTGVNERVNLAGTTDAVGVAGRIAEAIQLAHRSPLIAVDAQPPVSDAVTLLGTDVQFDAMDSGLAFDLNRITASAPGDLSDGTTFSLRDGRGRTLVFELDTLGDGVSGTNWRVDLDGTTDAVEVAERIAAAIQLAHRSPLIAIDAQPPVDETITLVGAWAQSNAMDSGLTFDPDGAIKASDPADLTDGRTFSLSDSLGQTLVFELDFDGTWIEGVNQRVDLAGTTDAVGVAGRIAEAIHLAYQNSLIAFDAEAVGDTVTFLAGWAQYDAIDSGLTFTGFIAPKLDVWIDYDGTGTWEDDEYVGQYTLTPGANVIPLSMPADDGSLTELVEWKTDEFQRDVIARFRLSSAGVSGTMGESPDGEVEDYQIRLLRYRQDFGDALAYVSDMDESATTIGADLTGLGAWHQVYSTALSPGLTEELFLGDGVTSELDGVPSAAADSDAGDDGLVGTSAIVPSAVRRSWIDLKVTSTERDVDGNPTLFDEGVYVNAWIDFDGDGDWDSVGIEEHILDGKLLEASDYVGDHADGIVRLYFDVPVDAQLGETNLRVRLGTEPGLSYTGMAVDGEVEDHRVTIVTAPEDYGDAPDSYGTLAASGGPRHWMDPDFSLGATVSAETDASLAGDTGDDGITFVTHYAVPHVAPALLPGREVYVSVFVNDTRELAKLYPGGHPDKPLLSAWVDFNGDGSFDGYLDGEGYFQSEQVFADRELEKGFNDGELKSLRIDVPASAVGGNTYARFRLSHIAGLGATEDPPIGDLDLLPDGEVEDYLVTIVPANASISGVKFLDENANGRRDGGEVVVAGVPIFLDSDGDGMLDQDETDTNGDGVLDPDEDLDGDGTWSYAEQVVYTELDGSYRFEQLFPGGHTVRELVMAGLMPTLTSPAGSIKASAPSELIDGTTFSVTDAGGSTVVFELDFDGAWTNQRVNLAGAANAAAVAERVAAAINAVSVAQLSVRADWAAGSDTVVLRGDTARFDTMTSRLANTAWAAMNLRAKGGVNLTDEETFALTGDDGDIVTFEFDLLGNGVVASDAQPIAITANSTPGQVAQAIVAAIRAYGKANEGFGITAYALGERVVLCGQNLALNEGNYAAGTAKLHYTPMAASVLLANAGSALGEGWSFTLSDVGGVEEKFTFGAGE
ncbi:MAG: matrixin family metalloprotease, partial [Rhodopirellula sp.]|nr:matrixin family metalloprotease [Rhodopirellula sp.]